MDIIIVFERIHGKKSHIFKRFLALYNLESQRWSAGSSDFFEEWFVIKLLHHLKHILRENHPQMKKLGVPCPKGCACCNCISDSYQRMKAAVVLVIELQLEQLVQTPDEFDWLFRLHAKQAMKKAWTFYLEILRSSKESLKRFYSCEAIAVQPFQEHAMQSDGKSSAALLSSALPSAAAASAAADLPAEIYD
jgi:hypothetical protein